MAITVPELAKAIRASVDAPTGTVLEDVTRLHAYADTAITRYAGTGVPDAIRDMAIVQLAQFLYDSSPEGVIRPHIQNAIAQSGVRAMLAPYRKHNLDVAAQVAAAGVAAGLDRDAVIAVLRELIEDWAFIGSTQDVPSTVDQGVIDNRIGTLVWNWAQSADEFTPVPLSKLPASIPADRLDIDAHVNELIDNSPKVVGLQEFEDALRVSETIVMSARVVVATAEQAVEIPGKPELPSRTPDREVVVMVTATNIDTATARFDLSALLAKPVVEAGSAINSTNGVLFDNTGGARNDNNRYLVGRNAAGEFVFGADTVDTYGVTIQDSAVIISRNQLTTNQQLPAPDASKWLRWNAGATAIENVDAPAESGGLTQSEVDARIRALTDGVDVVASSEFVSVAQDGGANKGIANLGLAFTAGGTTYTIGKLFQSNESGDNDYIGVFISPFQSRAKLQGYKLRINDHVLSFDDVHLYTVGSSSSPDEYGWDNQAVLTIAALGGSNTVEIVEPVGPENFVPAGANDGQWLRDGADGPEWATLPVSVQRGLHSLFDGSGAGVNVTDSNSAVTMNIQGFSPVFDLDENPRGELHVEVSYRMSGKSVTTLGFDSSASDTARETGIVFASTLAQAADFVLGGAIEGVEVADTPIHNGTAVVGNLHFYLVHNSDNQVGYVIDFVSAAGSNSEAFAVSTTLHVSFTATDGGAPEETVFEFVNPTLTNESPLGNRSITLSTAQKNDVIAGFNAGKRLRILVKDGALESMSGLIFPYSIPYSSQSLASSFSSLEDSRAPTSIFFYLQGATAQGVAKLWFNRLFDNDSSITGGASLRIKGVMS